MRSDRDKIAGPFWLIIGAVCVAFAGWYMFRRFDVLHPRSLIGLVVVLFLGALHLWRTKRRTPQVLLPTLGALVNGPMDTFALLQPLPSALGLAGLGFLVLAMARPQSKENWEDVQREGIDIVIALDVSESMLAKDLRPDRLEASKAVASDFIDGRPNDRIGLVVYGSEAYTQCPLTTDHRVLKQLFADLQIGLVEGRTAIGMGLATAINRLRESEAQSKVVILLSDGVNNTGSLQPLDAAQIAETMGVRVYTIGVGTIGKALYPVDMYAPGKYRFDYVDVKIDEPTMKQIAEMTGGKYFRATDEQKLRDIYSEIDRLEKTRIKVTEYSQRNEEFFPFAAIGGACLLFAFLLDRTFLRSMA